MGVKLLAVSGLAALFLPFAAMLALATTVSPTTACQAWSSQHGWEDTSGIAAATAVQHPSHPEAYADHESPSPKSPGSVSVNGASASHHFGGLARARTVGGGGGGSDLPTPGEQPCAEPLGSPIAESSATVAASSTAAGGSSPQVTVTLTVAVEPPGVSV